MSVPATPASGLRHEALFYDAEAALLASAVPFVRGGVERGELVLVNTGEHPVTALLEALFAGEDTVRFPDPPSRRTPVAVIDQYKRIMDRGLPADVAGCRAIGHLDLDHASLPWSEWLRFEAALNTVFESYPFQAFCAYDTRAVGPEIVTAMRQAHPLLVEECGRVVNPEYVVPAELVAKPEYARRPEPLQHGPAQLELEEVMDLRQLRVELYPPSITTDLPRDTVDDFVKAVGEVVANACAHGEGPVRLRLWTAPDRLVCTVTDRGGGIADPFLGYARPFAEPGTPAASPQAGSGLWAARQLCDVLDYGHTEDGFAVRLVTTGS